MKNINMKAHILIVGFLALSVFSSFGANPPKQDLKLMYDTPADCWEKSLPLGNGRIGMMPGGGIETDHIVLNDITMWSGSEQDALNTDAINYLPEIRQLLLEGKNTEAQEIMYEHFKCKGAGSGFGNGKDVPFGCFQMLGDLYIHQQLPVGNATQKYSRSLNLSDAVAATTFTQGDVQFTREYLASALNVGAGNIDFDCRNALFVTEPISEFGKLIHRTASD